MIDLQSILKISGMIMATGWVGRAASGLAPIIGAVADVMPEADDAGNDDDAWRIRRIGEWMALTRRLMEIPMHNDVRANTLKGKIRSDFFQTFGEMPRDRYVDKLHSDLVVVVKSDMAVRPSSNRRING